MSASVLAGQDAPWQCASGPDGPRRSTGHRRGARLYPERAEARIRLLDAMTELAREVGRERVTTGRLYRRAGLGRRVFETEFASVEECFEEAVERALDALVVSVSVATDAAGPAWTDRVVAAVVAFLRFLDEQPGRAWMAIVEPLGGGDRARFARRTAMDRLAALLAAGPTEALDGDRPRPRTAPDVIGGLWEMGRQYLWDGPGAVDLDAVAGSTIFLALSPYVGRAGAMRAATAATPIASVGRGEAVDGVPSAAAEAVDGGQAPGPGVGVDGGRTRRPGEGARTTGPAAGVDDARPAASVPDASVGGSANGSAPAGSRAVGGDAAGLEPTALSGGVDRGGERDPLTMIPVLTALAAESLSYLHDHPGAAGIDVSDAIGVSHASQTSRHLARLEELDLVWSRRDGRYKRWELTSLGVAIVERLRDR